MTRRLTPASSRCVAYECLNVCTVASLCTPLSFGLHCKRKCKPGRRAPRLQCKPYMKPPTPSFNAKTNAHRSLVVFRFLCVKSGSYSCAYLNDPAVGQKNFYIIHDLEPPTISFYCGKKSGSCQMALVNGGRITKTSINR